MYIKAETKAGKTLIVEKYYTSRYNRKGIPRGANRKATTEAQEKCNQRKEERKLTIVLNENFTGGDYHLVLDYRPEDRPLTPSGSPSKSRTVHTKDKTVVPEGGRRTEIRRSVRVWRKRCPASSSYPKSLFKCNDGRYP